MSARTSVGWRTSMIRRPCSTRRSTARASFHRTTQTGHCSTTSRSTPRWTRPRRPLIRYIVRRIHWGIAMLAIGSEEVFVIYYICPPADTATLRARRNATTKKIEIIQQALGLDNTIYKQYWLYMKGIVLHIDF